MFYNFNAHRTKKQKGNEAARDALAGKIVKTALSWQKRWACFMDRQASRVPLIWLKALHFIIVALAGGFCLYLLMEGASSKSPTSSTLNRVWSVWSAEKVKANRNRARQKAIEQYLDSLERAVNKQILDETTQKPLYP